MKIFINKMYLFKKKKKIVIHCNKDKSYFYQINNHVLSIQYNFGKLPLPKSNLFLSSYPRLIFSAH